MALSDRIVVMCGGVIQQEGSPDELYYHPTNSFVADFLGITNLFEGNVLRQDGANIATNVDGLEFFSQTRGQPQIGQKIFIAVRPSAINLNKEQSTLINSFRGVVVAMIYRGDQYLLRIQVGHLSVVVLITAEIQQKAGIQVGQEVLISWSPEDTWIMKD
jgi:ABC-type Fe3+/spermidine/putrescine transport system ATPase subunit